ncbi:unnamed protein product [Closterium sp. NIES-64]|nr:unnamed protein product [Closterium sp. NIES-64]
MTSKLSSQPLLAHRALPLPPSRALPPPLSSPRARVPPPLRHGGLAALPFRPSRRNFGGIPSHTVTVTLKRNRLFRPGFAAASAAGAAWASDPAEWRNAEVGTAEGARERTALGGGALEEAGTYDVASNERWLSQEKARLLTVQGGKVPGGLLLTRGSWQWEERGPSLYRLVGVMSFHNTTRKQEIFIPHVTASVVLLSSHSLHGISTHVSPELLSLSFTHSTYTSPPARPPAQSRSLHAIRAASLPPERMATGRRTSRGQARAPAMEVTVEIRAADSVDAAALSHLKAARLDVHYPAYGPHGSLPLVQHVILPLAFPPCPPPSAPHAPQWRSIAPGISVLAVPTHLLCHLDDPLLALRRYAAPYLQPGDVVTLGETPLAIMQGRFRHPDSLCAGPVARWACRRFLPTSSLATACGMQALIDVVGVVRVIVAVLLAALARLLLGKRGVFYQLAGEQARLIDDVTGTLPPYDQFITLGPLRPQETVDGLSAKLGCGVAIVDVNDLKKVQILAASAGVDHGRLTTALLPNPAGNAEEQTPIAPHPTHLLYNMQAHPAQ